MHHTSAEHEMICKRVAATNPSIDTRERDALFLCWTGEKSFASGPGASPVPGRLGNEFSRWTDQIGNSKFGKGNFLRRKYRELDHGECEVLQVWGCVSCVCVCIVLCVVVLVGPA